MKKRILSVFAAVAVLAGSVCGISAAEEEVKAIGLSPRAAIELVDGKIKGITGPITADWLKAQFDGEVKLTTSAGADIAGEDAVPSKTAVTADGAASVVVTIPGDASMDGKINLSDASAMLMSIAKWESAVVDTDAADLDASGGVNLSDVSTLLKYIAKWDVNIFDEALTIPVFSAGETEYKLLANDSATDEKIVSAIKSLTGKDIEVVTEVTDSDKFITVGKDLYNKYDFIDADAVKALEDTRAYIDTYAGDIYLTAASDNGILGCVNYITNQAFTPELDMNIAKGTACELGDLETLVRPLFTTVEIEGLKSSHRLLHVTDSHLTTIYEDEETAERRSDVDRRLNDWMLNLPEVRKASYLYFNEYFNYAENINAEAIMLTGDITDSPSQSNRDIFEKAVDGCTVPSYYVYGNHDWSWNTNEATGDVYHSDAYRRQYNEGFTAAVDKYDEDWNEYYNVIEYDDYMILSIDNAWQGFPAFRPAYNGIKAAFDKAKAEDKPMILMLHVPIHTDEMHENVDRIDGNGYCVSAESGNKMIYDLIVAEDTPVKAIFCGHVHVNYETMVDGRIPQYLTAAALEGWCRVVDLVPAAE